jgi:hypothetical protein
MTIQYDEYPLHVVAQLVEPQAERSWVRFPMVSLEFFIDIILPAALDREPTQSLTGMSTKNISWGVNVAGA